MYSTIHPIIPLKKLPLNTFLFFIPAPDPILLHRMQWRQRLYRLQPIPTVKLLLLLLLLDLLVQPRVEGFVPLEEAGRSDRHGAGDVALVEVMIGGGGGFGGWSEFFPDFPSQVLQIFQIRIPIRIPVPVPVPIPFPSPSMITMTLAMSSSISISGRITAIHNRKIIIGVVYRVRPSQGMLLSEIRLAAATPTTLKLVGRRRLATEDWSERRKTCDDNTDSHFRSGENQFLQSAEGEIMIDAAVEKFDDPGEVDAEDAASSISI